MILTMSSFQSRHSLATPGHFLGGGKGEKNFGIKNRVEPILLLVSFYTLLYLFYKLYIIVCIRVPSRAKVITRHSL